MNRINEKKKFQNLGNLIIDFAYNPSPELVYVDYLNYVKKAYNLKVDFLKKASSAFPSTARIFKEIDNIDKMLLSSILKSPIYNYTKKLLFYRIGSKESNELFVKLEKYLNETSPGFKVEREKVLHLVRIFDEWCYAESFGERIFKLQLQIRYTLEEIVKNKDLKKSENFKEMLSHHWHRFPSFHYEIDANGNLVQLPPININSYEQFTYEARHSLRDEINIKSGKAREYKRRKRAEGAKESYYG